MNRPLPRRTVPTTAASTTTSAPAAALRLNPFATALRFGLMALSCASLPAFAQTLPANGTVTVGTVDIPAAVGNTLTLTQTTPFAQINWESFSIGAGDTLNVTQDVSHFLLNNVVGNGGVVPMTNILGNLNAAGMVAIINRSGVMVGSTGVINVGGLIASSLNFVSVGSTNVNNGPGSITLDITDMAADARVVNDGTITTGAGGVTMLGRGVTNSGDITVADGASVQMVGTDGGTLGIPDDTAGQVRVIGLVAAPGEAGAATAVAASTSEGVAAVVNSGTVTAPGGTILLQASAAPGLLPLVNNTGLLVATGNATAINGGNVLLRGSNGSISSVDDGTTNTGIRALAGTGGTDGTITASVTDAGSDLTVSGLDAGTGAVSLTAGGSIAGDTGRDVTGGTLTIDSGGSTELDTEVSSVSGTGGTGISITDESDLSVSSLTATTGDLSVATTSGALTVTSATASDSGTITLSAGGTGNDLNIGEVATGSGSITLSAGDEIKEVAGGEEDADADVTTSGTLTATAATGINLQTAVGSLDGSVTGSGNLVIDQIGSGITLADVDTAAGSITVTADDTITASDVAATGGDVSLTADSGNIDVASVSGPNVTLTSTAGSIKEVTTGADIGADVTTAGTLTATAATGVNLQTAVGSLDGSVTGTGALVIDQIGSGITLTDVDTSDGALTVSADGTIVATDVAATGGDVSLTADSGNIEVASVSGPNVTLTSSAGSIQEVAVVDADADVTTAGTLTATAATGINLQTAVGSLDGTVTGSGAALSITESDGITLSSLDTNNGAIIVTANAGNIVAGAVNAGTANVTLDADQAGGQQIRDDVSSGTENDATTRIVGGTLTLLASGGIGAANEDVDIDGNSLVASTTTGALNINEANSVTLSTFTNNATGDVALSTGAAQTLSAIDVGSNDLRYVTRDAGANLTVGGTLTGGTVTLISGGAIIDGNASGPDVQATSLDASAASGIDLDTAVNTLTASGGAGAISIDQAAGDLVLSSVSNTSGGIAVNLASGSITATDVDAGNGNVNLTASGAINGSGATNVTGQSLSATSGTGGIDLDTTVASLSASAGGTGDIDIDNSTGIALTNVTTNAGNIRVDAAAGDITAGIVSAGSGGNVTLTADGAGQSIRDDGNDGAGPSRVAGNLVTLTAGMDIGSAAEDLDTAATTILATANGVINIDQLGGVSLDATNPGGAVMVTASGPMVVTDVSAGGAVNLGATGAGSDMQVASISGTDIVLDAGGAITDDGDAASDVNGSSLEATAGSGIDLDTAVATLSANVTGPGSIDISEADDISYGSVRTSSGPVTLAAGGDMSAGTIRGDGVSIQTDGDLSIRSTGQIDGRGGAVTIAAAGDVAQEPGRGTDPAIRGDSISIVAGGNVGLLTLPLSVDAGGAVAIDFSSGSAVAFITGIFGSLNESQRVLGLGSNTVLANNVGAIQSSFEERVSFKLDSSQFATETRIFSIEGTGILPPTDQRE